jgi:hypothetical protein
VSAFLFFSWNKFILTLSQFTVTLLHHGKGDEKDEKEERDEEVDEKEEVNNEWSERTNAHFSAVL